MAMGNLISANILKGIAAVTAAGVIAGVAFIGLTERKLPCPDIMQGMNTTNFWPEGCGTGRPPDAGDKSLVGLWDIEVPGYPRWDELFIAINRGHFGVGWRAADAPFSGGSVVVIEKAKGQTRYRYNFNYQGSIGFSVDDDGTITFRHGQYGYCNCHQIEFIVKPTGDAGVMTGTWKYRKESGTTIWRRRPPARINTVSYGVGPSTHDDVAFGSRPLRIEGSRLSCGQGSSRSNCRYFWIKIMGERLAGGHDVWIDPASHMEFGKREWLCADGSRYGWKADWHRCGSTNTEGDGVVGLFLHFILWEGSAPGPQVLWVDGQPIPIEMIIYGHPENTEPQILSVEIIRPEYPDKDPNEVFLGEAIDVKVTLVNDANAVCPSVTVRNTRTGRSEDVLTNQELGEEDDPEIICSNLRSIKIVPAEVQP